MSDDFGFAPPPFEPEVALVQLKRSLRDLKLAERGNAFELRGKRVVELLVEGAQIHARLARRLMLTPQWDTQAVKSAADQRKLVDEVKRRLARWEQED
ncbi:MAG TPA: hypothetical protein PLA97_04010 [Rubrivivax sp.]|nr:hypothetical protein [Rubrivivax sp.]